MSNRTLVELNHDFCPNPNGDKQMLLWAIAMVNYMHSGDKSCLPAGVEFKNMRHHSEPCPLEMQVCSGTMPVPPSEPAVTHNVTAVKIVREGLCREPGKWHYCSLPKGHAGDHEAYYSHDVNVKPALEVWPLKKSGS